ncbi:MAG: SOS cell division inhibitor SulA, partial [Thauera sp.]|nr:SOS cell division inhibitor SulA [Thauera sp.]
MALPLQRHADASLRAVAPAATGTHGVLAGLPAGSVWHASRLAGAAGAVLPTGFSALDAELPGGGWPAGALIELLADRPGVGELSLLLPLLGATPPA